ncbi:translocation protein [Moesziomyces antarcticus]|uniref:Translocation protein SEC62 n=2 Tax=Pseudozyma antarctica TaxID=84753 RepID=A0A081CD03_PSEA2|nr:translocation protein [Moesziomyces antarcticus]GAK64549.1 translocation protein [Moesziomyces antarcticus]SPO44942.1 related to translocation protein sec62 [Moesziomyces antarcticus]
MTKARRRNLRAASAPPLAIRRDSTASRNAAKPAHHRESIDLGRSHREPEFCSNGAAHLERDAAAAAAQDQIDLDSFIDLARHSAPPQPHTQSASSARPTLLSDNHNDDDAAVTYVSQEQQSSAPAPARNVVNFLRNKSGIKTRVGALNGKRVDYFKGSAAVKALLSPAYAKLKDVPKVTSKEEAEECLHNIIPFAFFLRVDRGASTGGKDSPKVVEINQQQLFKSELHYVWLFEGSQLGLKLAGVGMVAVMLAGVMFPLWPTSMRLGVWYLSVAALGLIGLFFAIAIVRLIFWLITIVVAKPGIWIFPNLFEDVGFVDSFIPFWAWDVPPAPKKKKAAGDKKKLAGSGGSSGARQQALSGLGGAAPTAPPQQPKPPQQAAQSAPATSNGNAQANGGVQNQSSGSGGPGASDSLDDIN